MNLLITICARAGSKGLPGKATKMFNGKPLCQWTMEQAFDFGKGSREHQCRVCSFRVSEIEFSSARFDYACPRCKRQTISQFKIISNHGKVVVSSDDPWVLETARSFGLDYFTRASSLCQDDTPKMDVLLDILSRFGADKFDCVMDLDITNPCRTVQDMKNCIQIFFEQRPKTVFSVTKARKNPYFNQIMIGEYGKPGLVKDVVLEDCFDCDYKWESTIVTSRQDAPDVYGMNASIYLYDPKWLMNPDNLSPITDNSEIYLMPDWTFCDIDNEIDFTVAEFIHKKYMAQA